MAIAKRVVKKVAPVRAAPARRKPPAKPVVLAEAGKVAASAAAVRAAELLAEIARRKARIAAEFYDIGVALAELLKKKLYVALEHASFDEMLTARGVMAPSQAYKLIKIVSTMPREKALAVGSEKTFLLGQLAEATPEPDTAEELLEKGTLPDGKPVAKATTREIQKAVRTIAKRTERRAVPREETEAERTARELQKRLRAGGAKDATVEASRRKGEMWLRVELPATQAGALLRR